MDEQGMWYVWETGEVRAGFSWGRPEGQEDIWDTKA
jgi:hypothetical protein